MNATDGTTIWRVPVQGSYGALMSSPVLKKDGTMFGIDTAGMGYAIDKNGTVLWKKQLGQGGPATDLAHAGTQLFALLNDGSIYSFDETTGNVLWSKPVGHSPEIFRHGGPIIDGRLHVYINSNDGNVYAFDLAGNQLWKLPHSGVATPGGNSFGTAAIGTDGTLYVPGNDGYLYAYH
jgi:outer membrane protein assembly factor BamB